MVADDQSGRRQAGGLIARCRRQAQSHFEKPMQVQLRRRRHAAADGRMNPYIGEPSRRPDTAATLFDEIPDGRTL
jgi:hypothetical protein